MKDHLDRCHGTRHDQPKNPRMFKMEIIAKDRDPLRRILREAIRIRDVIEGEEIEIKKVNQDNLEEEIRVKLSLLNSKREFHLPTLGAYRANNITDQM